MIESPRRLIGTLALIVQQEYSIEHIMTCFIGCMVTSTGTDVSLGQQLAKMYIVDSCVICSN